MLYQSGTQYLKFGGRVQVQYQENDLDPGTDTYKKAWTTAFVGANWFFNKHDLKLQTTFARSKDVKGAPGKDQDELFAQL